MSYMSLNSLMDKGFIKSRGRFLTSSRKGGFYFHHGITGGFLTTQTFAIAAVCSVRNDSIGRSSRGECLGRAAPQTLSRRSPVSLSFRVLIN